MGQLSEPNVKEKMLEHALPPELFAKASDTSSQSLAVDDHANKIHVVDFAAVESGLTTCGLDHQL